MPDALANAVQAGIANDDGSLTDYGQFLGRIRDLPRPRARRIKHLYHKGFIDNKLQPTEDGRLYFSSQPEVVERGPEAYARWKELGGKKRWDDLTDDGKTWLEGTMEFAGTMGQMVGGAVQAGQELTWDKSNIPGALLRAVIGESEQEKARKEVIKGGMKKGAMENQALGWSGFNDVVTNLPFFTDEERNYAEWNHLRTQQELMTLDAADAAGVWSAIFNDDPAKITEAKARVIEAQGMLSDEDAVEAERIGEALGMLADPSAIFVAGAGLGIRAGSVLSRRGLNLQRQLVEKQAQRTALQNAAKAAEAMPGNPAAKKALQAATGSLAQVSDEIASLEKALGVSAARDVPGGAARDALRTFGRKVAYTRLGRWMGDKTRSAGEAAKKVSDKVPYIPARLKRRLNLVKQVYNSAKILGREAIRRKSTIPYWRRVVDRAVDNPLLRSGAVTMDYATRPLLVAEPAVAAARRSITAQAPFSFLLTGDDQDWTQHAVGSGLIFSIPGGVQGMVHSMGGAPGVGKVAAFDALALADSMEFRRMLPDDQKVRFDALPPDVRKSIGVYATADPGVTFRFAPDLVDKFGNPKSGEYNPVTGTITINPNQRRPWKAVVSHEINHRIHHKAGLNDLIVEQLTGEQGSLKDANGNWRPEVQRFRAEYEKANGVPIDNQQLAFEWFAESLVPGTSNIPGLQAMMRKTPAMRAVNRWTQGVAEGIVDKLEFTRGLLLKNGVYLDKKGNPVKGKGAFGKEMHADPVISRLVQDYVKRNAGRPEPKEGSRRGRANTDLSKIRIFPDKDPNHPAVREMGSQYKWDDATGQVARDEKGMAIPLDRETLKARATAGAILEGRARDWGIDPIKVREGRGWNDSYSFTPEQWDIVLQDLVDSKVWNTEQTKSFRAALDAINEPNGQNFLFSYQKVYDTTPAGLKKARLGGVELEKRPGIPYLIQKSNAGNINIKVVDPRQIQRNAVKAAQSPLGRQQYRGDPQAILDDVAQAMKNHRDGIDNAQAFGVDKRNIINAVLGDVGQVKRGTNPVLAGGELGRMTPAVKTFSLHRINTLTALEKGEMPVVIRSIQDNLLPDVKEIGQPVNTKGD